VRALRIDRRHRPVRRLITAVGDPDSLNSPVGVKPLQALPFVEDGASSAYGFTSHERR